jgi:hypothetical protein
MWCCCQWILHQLQFPFWSNYLLSAIHWSDPQILQSYRLQCFIALLKTRVLSIKVVHNWLGEDFDAPSAMECSQSAPKLEGWCNDIWAKLRRNSRWYWDILGILWGKHIAPKCRCCCQSNASMTDLHLIARCRVYPKMSAKDKIHWKVDQIGQPWYFGVKRIHWIKSASQPNKMW